MSAPDASAWDFPYEPLAGGEPAEMLDDDLIVATALAVTTEDIQAAVASLDPQAVSEIVLARAPLFWARLRLSRGLPLEDVRQAFEAASFAVRYVAPAARGMELTPPPLVVDACVRARPSDWCARPSAGVPVDPATATRWFLWAEAGVEVDRRRCGTGAGTRLAVIDDDGADGHRVGFEREVAVGVDAIRRASTHGTLIAAWAVGTVGDQAFAGIAPAASPRLYAIPSAGTDVVSLPRAIARAVFDGADVIVCATYVERSWSPMLDDALAVASRLGRRGRGTAVVMPSGREASSPPDSSHASWSLALGDPASDRRVFCIGPSGRSGGWFLWRDRRSRLRPFANRGPAVRWLAPGDDLADPLQPGDRWCHAESSGAAAIAAGVLLLVLGANPTLSLRELGAVVTTTASFVPPADNRASDAADVCDLLPHGSDADGHNAKHGYGRMNALRACLSARDPLASALLAMGERTAAVRAFDRARRANLWSLRTARWAARQLIADSELSSSLRVTLRHLRLVSASPERALAHSAGAVSRQLVLFVRALVDRRDVPASVASELRAVDEHLRQLTSEGEAQLIRVASDFWRPRSAEAPFDDAPSAMTSSSLASAR